MEFKSFKLVQTNMSAQQYVYEGYKTEKGVHLEYYISTENWDYKTLEHAEFRNIVRKFDGDEKIFGELCALFGRCKIIEWTDFHGCDSQVLDGTGMSFTAVLADGTEVNAQGTNSFPENFSTFTQELHKLITTEKINSVKFTDGTYEVTLPESWVGTVKASFSEGFVSFFVDKTDGGELPFFIIDNDTYGYSSDSYKGRTEVGRLMLDEDIRFITARDSYSIASYAESVSEEAIAIWRNYESDKLAVIESLHGVNGYEFFPEDGTILYYSNAREMADKARSLWLSLNFAGEYPSTAKPVRIKRRNYVPIELIPNIWTGPCYTTNRRCTCQDRKLFLKCLKYSFIAKRCSAILQNILYLIPIFACNNISAFTLHRRNHFCIKLRGNLIICVNKAYVFSCSCTNSGITCSCNSGIVLMYNNNSVVILRKSITN